MASVTLDRAWLHLASDLATYERFWSEKPGDSRSKAGEVRAYASGRLRTITRVTRRQKLEIPAVDLTAAQIDTLDSWQSETVMYRDESGLLLFAAYFDLAVDPYPFGQGYEASFTLQQVTYSIEV